MSIVTEKLSAAYSVSVSRNKIVWKRGTRVTDISPAVVIAYLQQISWQQKDMHLVSYMAANDVLPEITAYFAQEEQRVRSSNHHTEVVIYESEKDYILAKIAEYGFIFSDRGDKIKIRLPNGNLRTVDSAQVELKLHKDLDAYNASIGDSAGRRFKVDTVKANFRSMLRDGDLTYLSDMQDRLVFKPDNADLTVKWLKNLHHVMSIKEDVDLWVMLMSHVMWLVKRRVYGMNVRSDLWLSIFGGQNVGKTYVFTNCIFKPLNAYYVMTELSKIEDVDREVAKFTENFVVNFDEIALGSSGMDDSVYKVSDKMLQNLKSILTRDELYIRRMGGQDQMKLDKTFVAVSSANTHLYDVIFDKTGMRRFFEFNTTATKQYDNALITKLADMSLDAWNGIDESLERGYWTQDSELGKTVFDIQKTYRPKNNVNEWMLSDNVKIAEAHKMPIDIKHAYSSYKCFCTSMGLKAYSMPAFRDILDYTFPVIDGMVAITIGKQVQETKIGMVGVPVVDEWSLM